MAPWPVAAASSKPAASFRFSPSLPAIAHRCWQKAAAPPEWNLTREEFQSALERSVARRFPSAAPGVNEIQAYLDTLHVADLALAVACSVGSPAAWDFFVAQFRPELYRAARAIAGDGTARELADSLYADLYGLRESEGRRKSLFDYFHGRSKLGTWLRAVLTQRHVDEIRRTRKMEPLASECGEEYNEAASRAAGSVAPRASNDANSSPDPERAKYLAILQTILTITLNALDPRDRLRLAYYYLDELTLSQVGRLLGEHEATASRNLERTRRDIRRRVEADLRDGKKMSEAQVRLCCEYGSGEWPFDLTAGLRPGGTPVTDSAVPGPGEELSGEH
jgi:RNA polymerase sigma-70 factor (ECF subfamily)